MVVDEVSVGDVAEVQKRLQAIARLQALEVPDDTESLALAILSSGVLPARAVRDAAHIAVTTVHGIDYLLT